LENFRNVHDMIRQEPVLATLRRPSSSRLVDRQTRIQQLREKAEELRTICDDVILDETRQMLLRLADTYERLAGSLESSVSPS
jgi:hypothetical protein